jgi:tetratricopeptide (TPR) repeat protein
MNLCDWIIPGDLKIKTYHPSMQIKSLTVIAEKRPQPLATSNPSFLPDESYLLSAANREQQNSHEIAIQNNDKLLEFIFEDNTNWICDAATLHELFPDIDNSSRSIDFSFEIPATLEPTVTERGIFGGIALKILNVFIKTNIPGRVASIAEKTEDKLLKDGEGLFSLDRNFLLRPTDPETSDKPFLLFLHGTNSNTPGAFSELAGSEAWKYIHDCYGSNVLAFEHRTLTKSPLRNVLELVKKLPASANLHIISHSRGGLLGEILCRYSATENNMVTGFSSEQLQLLEKYNRTDDVNCIKELNEIFPAKKLTVQKFIRIACPAAGTRLASKRIDTILNVLFNLLGGNLNPIADTLKELIGETIRTKEDINVLPGLEAMGPESPFIKILNDRVDEGLPGTQLAIISGNGKLSGTLAGLYFIIGKFFYGQRNDLVVNTDSMYLGSKRNGNIQYFFDQGSEVDHFRYFKNDKTRQAIALALKSVDGAIIPGFTSINQYEVPASDRGFLGLDYGELFPYPNPPSGKKPILIFLPGIMGSNLSRNDAKLWVAYLKMLSGGLYELLNVKDDNITATSIISSSYSRIVDRFSYSYDVVVYPFDWRRQLNDCAKDFNDTIISLLKLNQPIKIIGHSMGGVLVRDFIINHSVTWSQLNASKGFRLLFLGSPLGGSMRILTVLFGFDPIINMLNMLDSRHTKKELIALFANFPGILSLLPLTTGSHNDFAEQTTWKNMADAHGDSSWPIPDQVQLDIFKSYRDNINLKSPGIDYSKIVYIAGKDKFTPEDYYNDVIPPRTELVFLCTSEGDQSVTWESGIPEKLIASKSVYYVDVTHGALADEPDIFDGIEDILEKGSTTMLSSSRPVTRGEEKTFRMPEIYDFDFSERGVGNTIFGRSKPVIKSGNEIPISVSVSNGDLAYASFPIVAGHFLNDGILYAEKSIDLILNGRLSSRHRLSLYPGDIGTNTVVSTSNRDGDFPGAIIVGLGAPGTLTAYLLTKSVTQGVAKYLLNVNSAPDMKKEVGISALIIGCGYGGLSLESSIKAIIEGVNLANKKIQSLNSGEMKLARHIEFLELLEDRALGCLYALSKIENRENNLYNIRIANKKIRKLFGFKKRLPMNIAEEWWNRITVKHKEEIVNSQLVSSLVFSSSTGGAREEQQELYTSTALIDLFIEQISTKNQWTASSAKALFELMIPNEFKERLKKKGSINWILDEKTAAYPWELLQENITDAKPLCIGAGMIRQLSTNNYTPDIKKVATEIALVVGDPSLDGFIGQLAGARNEALEVQAMLTKKDFPNVTLINKSASQLISQLFSNDFKIIHLAGHGVYNPGIPSKSGMVIGKEVYLTTSDIKQLSTIPELVFVNCCHLGKQQAVSNTYFQDRFRLAANIGTQLIQGGVKAVVAAGWAVNDKAAADFARIFYSYMFDGYNFGDSVKEARTYLYENYPSNNTWGAYQCYGDPFYKLTNRTTAKKDTIPDYTIEEEALVDLNNLKNILDTRNISCADATEKLKAISASISKAEIRSGTVLELEATILLELGDYDSALEKYELLRREENATFSVAALEKLCNIKGKKCVKDYNGGMAQDKLIQIMREAIAELDDLVRINKTSERLSLLGSAYKRLGLLSTKEQKQTAYSKATEYYQEAYDINKKAYAMNNWIMLQSIIDLIDPKIIGFGPSKQQTLAEQVKDNQSRLRVAFRNMDYWELTEDFSYELSAIMLTRNEVASETWTGLADRLGHIWKSAGSKGKRMAEVENLEIISDALSLSADLRALQLKARFDKLKEQLTKLI